MRISPDAVVLWEHFLIYAVVRIVLENYREPDSQASMISGLSRGQFYSVFFVLTGVAFLIYGWSQKDTSPSNSR